MPTVTLPASVRLQTLHVNPGSLAQSKGSAVPCTSACEALSLGRRSDRVRAAQVLSPLWPLLELHLEHFSQSTYCPQTSWNTTVCATSRGLLHLRLSSQPQLLYVPRLHLLPPGTQHTMWPSAGLVVQAWVSAPSPATQCQA